jgi:hypothetical protein
MQKDMNNILNHHNQYIIDLDIILNDIDEFLKTKTTI